MITIPCTESRNLDTSESGSRFSNEGAAAQVVLTLPPCAPDLEFEFLVVENQHLRVDPDNNKTEELLYQHGGTASAAMHLRHNGPGSSLRVVGTGSSKWIVTNPVLNGTWDE